MYIVERANLKSNNDKLGMLLEIATVEALKRIPLLIVRHSQFNEFYQQDRDKGPDIIFEFDDHTTGVIECKNVNRDFIVSKNWFKAAVDKRFSKEYRGFDAYIVVISKFRTSPPELANELRKRCFILEVGFQVHNQYTYDIAIPRIANKLKSVIELIKKNPRGSK